MGCRRKNTLYLSLDFGANDGTLLPRLTHLETSPSPQKFRVRLQCRKLRRLTINWWEGDQLTINTTRSRR